MFLIRRSALTFFVGALAVVVANPALGANASCFAASEEGQRLVLKGELRAARPLLEECAESSCPKEVSDDCRQRLHAIDEQIPSIVVEVNDGAGGHVDPTAVRVDGSLVPKETRLVLLDPGKHHVAVELASGEVLEKDVELARGQKAVVVTLSMYAQTSIAPPSSDASTESAPATSASTPAGVWFAGAVGVVGLACFAGFGIAALHQSSDLHGRAPGTYTQDDVDALKQKRTIADLSLAVGVIGIGTAVVLYVTRSPSDARPPTTSTAFDVHAISGGALATFGATF